MYQRCIAADIAGNNDDMGESILAACAAVQSIVRMLDAI